MDEAIEFETILKMRVAVITRDLATRQIACWASEHRSRYVCVANVHMCMESFDCDEFAAVVNQADLTVPDGLPLVWGQRLLGRREAAQVRGEDLAHDVCRMAERQGMPVALYGGSPEVLDQLQLTLAQRYPELDVRLAISPPFRPLSEAEDRMHVNEINDSGARILFVGLGCPKQEKWMAVHQDSVHLVMLGVGAAFDFIAGSKKSAPVWMRRAGLEWVYRLAAEPRRLWKRYLRHNPRFVWFFCKSCLGSRFERNH
jgi:N-acetylglucosaminyldiphosphoundecaprenol N-acetyl-beta-D-mannosaminyltransferase